METKGFDLSLKIVNEVDMPVQSCNSLNALNYRVWLTLTSRRDADPYVSTGMLLLYDEW